MGESPGIKLANSYCFVSKHPEVMEHPEKADAGCAGKDNEEAECHSGWKWAGFRGPGHGVPFYDPVSGEYYFVHHIRVLDGELRETQTTDYFSKHRRSDCAVRELTAR